MLVLKLKYSHVLAVTIPVAVSLVAYLQPFVAPRLLFLDPLVAALETEACCKTYLGIVSTFGIILWVATASVCLFTALVLHSQLARRPFWEFAAMAGLLTAWLALDDAFLIHENIAPKLGIPQTVMLLLIVAFAIVYALRCWRIILSHDALMFGLAGFFLAASVGIDVFHASATDLHFLAEDGAKFVGIVCWTCFHLSAMKGLFSFCDEGAKDSLLFKDNAALAAR